MCPNLCFLSPSEKIRKTAGITAVFVNVERLSPLSEVSSSENCFLAAHREVSCPDGHFFIHAEGAGGSLGG